MKRKHRKDILQLLKCNDTQFSKIAMYTLLLASKEQRQEIYTQITQNSFLKRRYLTCVYKNDLTSLGEKSFVYNRKISSDDSICYANFLIELYKNEINDYILLRKKYYRALFSQDYDTAKKIIDQIDSTICVSMWSCGQRLLLAEKQLGLAGNKQQLEELNLVVPQNFISLVLLGFYSSLAEVNISYENYQTEITKYISSFKESDIGRYLYQKLSLQAVLEESDVSLILQIDSQYSIIDLFNDFEIVIPFHIKNNLCVGNYKNDLLAGIDSPLSYNLQLLSQETSKQYVHSISEDQKKLYCILEAYTKGDYSYVITSAQTYLIDNPSAIQVAILLCKASLNANIEYKDVLKISYINHIYEIYKLGDNYRESVLELKKEFKQNFASPLRIRFQNFLSRKHLITLDGTVDYIFISSMLDESLHPNFLRFLSGNVLNHVAEIMKPLCPISVDLEYAKQTGNMSLPNLSSVDYNRYQLLLLEQTCNSGDISKAKNILESILLSTDETNLYIWERVSRVRLKLYSTTTDYRSAINLLVSVFFKNKDLFDRLYSDNFIQIPKKLRDQTAESELSYLIYISICFPTDYSRQIIAYNNFLDFNNYSSILDAIDVLKLDPNPLIIFFFENVCSINLLKRDSVLCELGITPESVRLQILRILADINPHKKYIEEINNISTVEVLREKLNSINKSRINVDIDKIQHVHQEQWEETFNKYLSLCETGPQIVGVDLDNISMADQISKMAENLNLQIKSSPQLSQATLILRNLIEQILEECLFSTQYGLETYLSSRIRHGYCRGQLTSFLDELHLLSLRTNGDSKTYVNEYWKSHFSDKDSIYEMIQKRLTEFMFIIEHYVDEVCSEWLRISQNILQFPALTLCNSANGGKALIFRRFRHLPFGRVIRISRRIPA